MNFATDSAVVKKDKIMEAVRSYFDNDGAVKPATFGAEFGYGAALKAGKGARTTIPVGTTIQNPASLFTEIEVSTAQRRHERKPAPPVINAAHERGGG